MMADKRDATSGGGLNPEVLSVAAVAQLLARASGWPITEAMIQADIAVGAPANADGTIHLVHYTAWLVREMEMGRGA